MRIEQLDYLITISQHHSLNLAAEALHISTQALSASIKNLEAELDVVLLERTNRGVSFTEKGQKVLQYARITMKGFQDLQGELRETDFMSVQNQSALSGTLYIHTVPVFLESILPRKIKAFQQIYPNISVQIVQNATSDIYKAVQDHGQSTLGLVLLPCIKNTLLRTFLPTGNLSFRPINTSRFLCCVSKESPFARHKSISINKILKEPLVIYTTGAVENSPLLYLLKQYSAQLQITSSISSITFWAKAIKEQIGIGFLNNLYIAPESMVKKTFDELVFLKVKEPLATVNGFLYNDKNDPIADAFMQQFPVYHPAKGEPDFCEACMVL